MTPGIWTFIGSLVGPLAELVDNLHTSDAEKAEIKGRLYAAQAQLTEKVISYEGELLSARAKVVAAEASGQSWLQRSWRPITMLTFLVLVVCDSFDLLAFRLSEEAWNLLQIGLGGYVVGRSLEKVAPGVTKAMKGS